ncbi:MAG: PD-(D/E)XK nuclease family protein, partial [Armatimonadota bacterium]
VGGHSFVSVADAVMREAEGGVNAVRWLSTRKPPSVNDIYESTGWGLFYACARDAFPDDDDLSVTMYSLRRGSGHRVRFSEQEVEALVRRATRLADKIRVATEFPCVTGMHCRWCRSRSRCPALE